MDYEKRLNDIDDETYKKYEADCLDRFKTEIKEKNTKADAFSPIVLIPTYTNYKTWKKTEESVDNTALNLANEQCKDILDKINH